MSINNEISNELSRIFSNFRDAFRDANEHWDYKGFDAYGLGIGQIVSGGISGGPLFIEHENDVGSFDLEYRCAGLTTGVGVGGPVNLSCPFAIPIGDGIVLPGSSRKLDFSSFEGTYIALEFASSSVTPITGYSVMAMITGLPFSYASLIPLAPIELIKKGVLGKAIIYMIDTQWTPPSVGFNLHLGSSFLYSNDAKFNPIQVPPRGQPILSVGDQIHTIESGEWLSKIAQHYYGDFTKWEALYNWDWTEGPNKGWNKQVIGNNPDLIEPGMKIIIPPRNVINQYRKN